ncbi:SRPBCC family protein [Segetibacter koreensis]|uniref:SRPBCC family protein n=1 Tax=Segetibacter koreensis TaxID=398037 RepID=UPI00037A7998|nr:SRPBCC family protein [Segetibacter koreensis]
MEINKALKVEARKSYSVSPDELYKAWTDPEQLKQWWKPMGNTLKEVTNDIKVGGRVRYVFEDDKLIISGEYMEVKEKEKLVYSWNWELPEDAVRNAEYKLTVNFASKDYGSEIHILQENFQDDETLLPHQQGWEKGLTDLKEFLEGSNTGSEDKKDDAQAPSAESGGYREDPAQVKVGGG